MIDLFARQGDACRRSRPRRPNSTYLTTPSRRNSDKPKTGSHAIERGILTWSHGAFARFNPRNGSSAANLQVIHGVQTAEPPRRERRHRLRPERAAMFARKERIRIGIGRTAARWRSSGGRARWTCFVKNGHGVIVRV